MSVWHVNATWSNFYAFDHGPVHWVDVSDIEEALDLDTRDALSEPGVDSLLPAALALWPRGSAWGAPGMEAAGQATVFAKLTRALLAPFARLFARAWQLTLESRAASLVDSLEDWELDHGLPDPCVTEPQTVVQRKSNLRARVSRLATVTPADIVRLAARMGYIVALEEPVPFRVGQTPLGQGRLSNVALGQQWALHILDAPIRRFRVGQSQVGVDRLTDFDISPLQCAIRRISPAWSIFVISVAPLPRLYQLAIEDGIGLEADGGRALCVVLTPDH